MYWITLPKNVGFGFKKPAACCVFPFVNKEKIVEEYKDLYHYVSLINGKLKKNVQTIDIIKSMMPGGSVIGCPKINTLNLLNHQEKEERNIYTGSFGYIMFNGDMKFNIIIRSILYYKNMKKIVNMNLFKDCIKGVYWWKPSSY